MKPKDEQTSRKETAKPEAAPEKSASAGPGSESGRGLPFRLRWFMSKTVREAASMRKHVLSLLNAQRDLLAPQAVTSMEGSLTELETVLKNGTNEDLRKQMPKLEEAANKWLKPYPNPGWRENIEVLLVALAVAMAIRTFFLQPFKIPTGSMQPTLYGVMSVPNYMGGRMPPEMIEEQMRAQNAIQPTKGLQRMREWFAGVKYIDIKAKVDGTLDKVGSPVGIRIIDFWQTLTIGGKGHTIYFPPDYGTEKLELRAGLFPGQQFRKGDTVVRMRTQAGDHLFVDRLTYNFRKPRRGEIVVFQTAGMIPDLRERRGVPPDQFYIKRMVALGDETVKIGEDHHLVINGRRLDASTPGFEYVYGWHELNMTNAYIGHQPVELFANDNEYRVPPKRFLVMGDNTRSSLDSRYFGDVDQDSIIGKSFFVYWPITSRFGLGYR